MARDRCAGLFNSKWRKSHGQPGVVRVIATERQEKKFRLGRSYLLFRMGSGERSWWRAANLSDEAKKGGAGRGEYLRKAGKEKGKCRGLTQNGNIAAVEFCLKTLP